jgi:hypothetical protein
LHGQALDAKAIKYSDYKVMAGVAYLPNPAVKLSTTIGYALKGDLCSTTATGPT